MGNHKLTILAGCLWFTILFSSIKYSYRDDLSDDSVYLLKVIDDNEYNPGDFVNLGFSRFAIAEIKEEEARLRDEYDLTAILIHSKRLPNIKYSVQQLLDTRLFREIIVWNSNSQINISQSDLVTNNQSSNLIRGINSIDNIRDSLKYLACLEAKTRACFYANEESNTSPFIHTLVASFRSEPNIPHVITDAYTYQMNLKWIFFDSKLQRNIQFSSKSFGNVFLRAYVQQHLQIFREHLNNDNDE
jgi:hypothetical protein